MSTHGMVSTHFLPPSLASFFLSSSPLSLSLSLTRAGQGQEEQRARWERAWRPEGVGGDALARFRKEPSRTVCTHSPGGAS